MRKMKVDLAMALASSTAVNGYWRIQITDPLSNVCIAILEMPPEQFGRALGAQYQSGVTAQVADAQSLARVGLRRQIKRVVVRYVMPENYLDSLSKSDVRLAAIRYAATAYEVDGWKIALDDGDMLSFNHHMAREVAPEGSAKDGYAVTFHRYVEPGTPEPEVAEFNPHPLNPHQPKAAKPKGKTKKAR